VPCPTPLRTLYQASWRCLLGRTPGSTLRYVSLVNIFTVTNEIWPAVARAHSVREGMHVALSACAAARPDEGWALLGQLDWEQDHVRLARWLKRVLVEKPPPATVTGLWFGLFNPVRRFRPSADMYISGGLYDSKNRDWMCGPSWWPDGRYASSRLLDSVYAIAYRRSGLRNDAEYPIVSTYARLAVRELATAHWSLLLGSAAARRMTAGFDDGDRWPIGMIDSNGFTAG